jgi:quinone-modifying oxidoreductase subunit QmoC
MLMNFINPDIDFIKAIKKDCGSALSTCIQCGSCSAVCELSPERNPFPRKEMIWTSWGLKDRLLGDPDIWLCFQCGDCTASCPRGVKPGDVLSSVRNFMYSHYAQPGFFSKILGNPKYILPVILFPVIIISVILLIAGTFQIPEGDVDYSKFFPHTWLNISFMIFVLLIFMGVIRGVKKFWSDMKRNMPFNGTKSNLVINLIKTTREIFFHNKFRQCNAQHYRYSAHLLVFWGFIILLAVTVFAILSTIFFDYPLTFWHPVKITANAAAVFLLFGCAIMIYKRLINRDQKIKSNYADWFFLISFLLLTISGVLTEVARFENWKLAYFIYFIHLVLVWMVIMYAPYTKFAHFIYRTIALVYAEHIGRYE